MKINILFRVAGVVGLFGAGLAVAGCAGQQQAEKPATSPVTTPVGTPPATVPGSPRLAINDPSRVKSTAFFDMYERAKAQPVRATGQRDASPGAVQTVRDSYDADKLADNTMRSWDGIISAVIQRNFVAAVKKGDPNTRLGPAQNQMHFDESDSAIMAAGVAAHVHWTAYRLMTQVRRERGASAQIAGSYDVATNGTCPFAAGPIEVTQRDFVIQGARDGKPVLWGALGSKQIYIVANEQRYASTSINPATGRPALNAPDKPSELFAGTIDAKKMALDGKVLGGCQFTLTRKA